MSNHSSTDDELVFEAHMIARFQSGLGIQCREQYTCLFGNSPTEMGS